MDKPTTLIIGLGQTVGEALCHRYMAAGHAVLAVDPNRDLLDEALKTAGDKLAIHNGPIHTRLGLKNGLAAALEAFGHVDNVVYTPALPSEALLGELEPDEFETALVKAVSGAVTALNVFTPEIVKMQQEPDHASARQRQAGSFVFILSLSALMVEAGRFTESIIQHAVQGVVKSAAVELADQGIRVNAISALRPRAEKREPWLKERTPLGRPALAEEIAESAYFLTNPASAIITGETLVLDGGRRVLSGVISQSEDD